MDNLNKIVIINMIPNTVGDSLMLIPLINVIKSNAPNSHISITSTEKLNYLFEGVKNLDEIIIVKDLHKIGEKNRKRLSKAIIYTKILFNLVKKLRKKYDLAVVSMINFPPLHIIPFFAGIKYSIGYQYKDSVFSFLLTKKIKFPSDEEYYNNHYVKTVLKVLCPLHYSIKEENLKIYKKIKEEEISTLLQKLKKYSVSSDEKVIIIQPGSKWKSRRWPKENFIILCKEIIKNYKDHKIVLIGNHSEKRLGDDIKKQVNHKNVLNLCGEMDLKEVATLTKIARISITNDSGIAHISSAVGTKTIVLYGASDPNHSAPLGIGKVIKIFKNDVDKPCITDKKDCPYDYICMKKIQVSHVMEALKKEL